MRLENTIIAVCLASFFKLQYLYCGVPAGQNRMKILLMKILLPCTGR